MDRQICPECIYRTFSKKRQFPFLIYFLTLNVFKMIFFIISQGIVKAMLKKYFLFVIYML